MTMFGDDEDLNVNEAQRKFILVRRTDDPKRKQSTRSYIDQMSERKKKLQIAIHFHPHVSANEAMKKTSEKSHRRYI